MCKVFDCLAPILRQEHLLNFAESSSLLFMEKQMQSGTGIEVFFFAYHKIQADDKNGAGMLKICCWIRNVKFILVL